MQPSATGRILFWHGGSLWIGLAGEPTGLHAHHAVQISLAFPRGRVQFQSAAGSWTSYTAALVAAHHPHAFEARGQLVAQIFVEPESHEGRPLHRQGVGFGASVRCTRLRQVCLLHSIRIRH